MSRFFKRAFTLVEMLVVLAIVMVLAALLFPVFAKAREQARQKVCVSNARQLVMGVMAYSHDYDDVLPPSTNYDVATSTPTRIWTRIIEPYIKSEGVFQCSSAPQARFSSDWSQRGTTSIGYTTLTAYDSLGVEGFTSMASLSLIQEPTRTPLFGDTANGPTSQKYRGYVFDPYNGADNADARLGVPLVADRDLVVELSTRPPNALKPPYARHFAVGNNQGRTTLLFADGHAKSYSALNILSQDQGANLIWRFR